jgi:intracellular septation protein
MTSKPSRKKLPTGLKLALDFGPLLVFFAANKFGGVFVATGAFMAATAIAMAVSWMKTRHIPPMLILTGVIVLVFGGLTLWLQDETFIKIKPTVLNWGFALVFLAAPLFFKKNLLRMMLGDKLSMPDFAWSRLNLLWVGYFFAIGAANLYVANNMSAEAWGKFRVFGMYGALLAFMVLQGFYVYRHMAVEPEPAVEPKDPA